MNPSPFSLENQRALITGGATGLGLGMARCLVAAGATVVLVGRRETELQRAVGELGPAAAHAVGDVTAIATLDALVGEIESRHGPVDLLVNNAGNHVKKPAVDHTDEDFLSVMQTHVLGSFALTRALSRRLLAEKRTGSILFISSMAALFGIPKVIAYSAAKSALTGMVRALATELSPHGIRVNAIAPGWILTDLSRKALDGDPARRDRILARTPMARFGELDDIGQAAVYLSSPAAKFVTGVILPVDGGASVGF